MGPRLSGEEQQNAKKIADMVHDRPVGVTAASTECRSGCMTAGNEALLLRPA